MADESIAVLLVRSVVVLEHVLSLELLAAVRVGTAVRPEVDLMVQLVTGELAVSAELLRAAVHIANEQILIHCGGGGEELS